MAKITLIGMHNYTDEGIWDGLTFPTGFDKSIFIDTVLLNYGELETLYADPDIMKYAITAWGKRNQWSINKAITAISIAYEPLQNYDRHETRTGEMSEAGTHSTTGSGTTGETHSYDRDMTETTTAHYEGETSGSKNTTTSAESDTTTTTARTESGQTEHTVSAYDSSSYSADNKDVTSGSVNETVTASSDSSGTGTETTSGTAENDSTETGRTLIDESSETSGTSSNTEQGNTSTDREESETIRAWGNIGVTTSQQMLQSELDLSLYNIYDTFAGIFACDLLLMIY